MGKLPTISLPVLKDVPILGGIFGEQNLLTYISFLMVLVTALLLVSLVGCGEKKGNNTVTPPPAATDHGTADNSRKSHDTPGADRRNAAARASGRSRYFNSAKSDLRYRQMLSNGRVHDADGFLFDGENTHYNTLR